MPELVLSLTDTRGTARYTGIMRRLIGADPVILDDWGLEDFSVQGRRNILEIIEPRRARRSTMIVTRLLVSPWGMRSSAREPSLTPSSTASSTTDMRSP